jgi:hypothetical protein
MSATAAAAHTSAATAAARRDRDTRPPREPRRALCPVIVIPNMLTGSTRIRKRTRTIDVEQDADQSRGAEQSHDDAGRQAVFVADIQWKYSGDC